MRWLPGIVLTTVLIGSCDRGESSESDDGELCPACSIEHELVASLGTSSGEAALLLPLGVAEDQRGRFWVFAHGAMPVVFDRDGTYLTTVGTRGEGPGEMSNPRHLWLLPEDSVAVVDGVTIHIWDPDLEFVRRERVPLLGARDAVVLEWPSEVVVNALDPNPLRRDHPLHLVDFSGREPSVLKSFGGDGEPVTTSTLYTRLPRDLHRAEEGGYWSTSADLYQVLRYAPDHEIVSTVVRHPEWFQERSDLNPGTFDRPPSPTCKGTSVDRSGHLWMFCAVASADYQRAYADDRRDPDAGIAEVQREEIDSDRLYDTWIEVIDPEAGGVAARLYFDGSVLSVLSDAKVAVRGSTEAGDPVVLIYEFELVVPGSGYN